MKTAMRIIMAIGTKNLVRIKMMEFIINVMIVKEHNRRSIAAMVREVTGSDSEEASEY